MRARSAAARSAGLAAASELIEPDGSVQLETLSPDAHVALYARIVHRGQHGLVEVVRASRQKDGQLRMRSRRDPRRYLDAGDAYALCRLAGAARGRGEEVFATPLPRERPEPGKSAVGPGSVAWVDLDENDAERLREIDRLRPHLWVASGAGQHLYWRLRDDLAPAGVEELNRRLCHRLGGDAACCEYGRIMRLPGTFNQKRGAWCRIVRADRQRPPVDPEAVRATLPDPDPPPPNASRASTEHQPGDRLALITPPVYFDALAGVEVPDGGGLIRCPLPDHDDAYASCHVYGEAEDGWWCFGCARGGRIYDLASLLEGGPWGRELRGDLFRRVRELVAAAL